MRYPRSNCARILIVLPLLICSFLTTGGWSATATLAQGGQATQVVPDCDPTQATCNTYEFSGSWVPDPNTNVTGPGTGFFALTNQALTNTSFIYTETPWVPNHVPDNQSLVEQYASATLSQIGLPSLSPVATGALADGTLWNLYAVPAAGEIYGMLFAADTADPSQNDVDIMFTSPASTFDQALIAVQNDIRVNGESPLAGIDPAQAMTALSSGAAITPGAGVTPTPGTTPTLPPAPTAASGQTGQSITIGADTLTYAGDWQLDPANSSEGVVATFQDAANPRILFSYLASPDRESGGNVQVALQILDAPSMMSAQNAQQVASEVLPSGSAYELYTWEREGAAEIALFLIDVTTVPGTLRAQVLLAPPDQFLSSLGSAKESFQINGEPAFDELDPSTIAGLLADSTPVTPTALSTPASALTPTTSGGFSESPRGRLTPIPATTPSPTVGPTTSAGNAPITVAGATITYAGTWTYDDVNSTPGEIAFFDTDALTVGFFGYQSIAGTPGNPLAALHQFNESYLAGLAPTTSQLVTEQTLPGGQGWALYTMDLMGLSYVMLTYAEESGASGQMARQQLFVQPAEFDAALADAQLNIQIDGVPAFQGLDPTMVAALLESAPAQPNTGTTPTPGT